MRRVASDNTGMGESMTDAEFAAITAPLQALLDAHHAKLAARRMEGFAGHREPINEQEDKA